MSHADTSTAEDDLGPMISGKAVILSMFGFAVVASIVSWIYYARLQERPLALWGSTAAELILQAPQVRAYRLAPEAAATTEPAAPLAKGTKRGALVIEGVRYVVVEERDVSRARGMSHIRQGLVHDRSFGWADPPCERQPEWAFALVFASATEEATVAFAFDCELAALADSEQGSASIRPVSAAIEGFLREQFSAAP